MRDLEPLARPARIAAVAYFGILSAGTAAYLAWHYGLMHRLLDRTSEADARLALQALGWVLLAMLPVFAAQVAAAITSLRWHHRAQANLADAGLVGLRWSPTWAVLGWLIPYANLVVPFLVMRETWRGSHARAPTGWEAQPVPAWLNGWWALWVGGSLLSVLVHFTLVFTTRRAPLPWPAVFAIDLAAIGLPYLFALALWLRVIRSISAAQAGLAARAGRFLE